MMTDPIADMLTRIRNAIMAKHVTVDVPLSKMKRHIAEILKSEGFIDGFDVIKDNVQGILRINLRYVGEDMESPVHGLRRVSRPGCRVYAGKEDIPVVLGGLGVSILSTNKGMMTGREAIRSNVGGEVICAIW